MGTTPKATAYGYLHEYTGVITITNLFLHPYEYEWRPHYEWEYKKTLISFPESVEIQSGMKFVLVLGSDGVPRVRSKDGTIVGVVVSIEGMDNDKIVDFIKHHPFPNTTYKTPKVGPYDPNEG